MFRQGQLLHARGFLIRFVHNQRRTSYRVAVVVSRKVSKSAVVRNRIRRRIYEAVRAVETNITSPYDIVFLVREAELAKVTAKDLAGRVQSQLRKAGIIANQPSSATDKNHAIVEKKEHSI